MKGKTSVDGADRVRDWNDALLDLLLPVLPAEQAGTPILLACDDEAVRTAGEAIDIAPGEAAADLAVAVRSAIRVNQGEGIRYVLDLKLHWVRSQSPRPRPDFLAVLCLLVLAASRMGPSEKDITLAYYPHLRRLLGMEPMPKDPGSFYLVPDLFRTLATWLSDDEKGRRGELVVADDPWPPYVGHCVEQTVFREGDRRALSEFFSETRFRRWGSHLDNLMLLRRWGGRHRLTDHALRLVDDDQHADRVRGAIASARRAWDGSVLEGAGGRSYEVRLRLGPRPLALFASATNPKPVAFEHEGKPYELFPEREIQLPWGLMHHPGKVLGNPTSAAGAIRMPSFDDTILFENFDEEGLRRVKKPTADRVWVLSKDSSVQMSLRDWKIDRSGLPYPWQGYRDAPIGEIPGVHRVMVDEDRQQLALAGGLRVQESLYLSGFSPYLEAGDIGEDEGLAVRVNGDYLGRISSQQRLALPADGPKSYEVVVPDLGFHTKYHVVGSGAREGYGTLSYDPSDPSSLRSGARVTREEMRLRISGAQILPRSRPPLPIMRRRPHDILGILADGQIREWVQPEPPAWLALVNYPVTPRWEVPSAGVVWLLCVVDRDALRFEALNPTPLSREAAAAVLELGTDARVRDALGDRAAAVNAWQRLLEEASKT